MFTRILLTPLAIFIVSWVLFKIFTVVVGYFSYLRLKKQGVVFLGDGSYSLFRDYGLFGEIMKKYPSTISTAKMMKENLKTEQLPPVVGLIFFGTIVLFINSPDLLPDLYINKN